eukprot:6709634-Prymnesium_polylepis.1
MFKHKLVCPYTEARGLYSGIGNEEHSAGKSAHAEQTTKQHFAKRSKEVVRLGHAAAGRRCLPPGSASGGIWRLYAVNRCGTHRHARGTDG